MIAQYKGGMVGENSQKPAFGEIARMQGHAVADEPLDMSGTALPDRAMRLLK